MKECQFLSSVSTAFDYKSPDWDWNLEWHKGLALSDRDWNLVWRKDLRHSYQVGELNRELFCCKC